MSAASARLRSGLSSLTALLLAACGTTASPVPAVPPDPLYLQLDEQARQVAEKAVQDALESQGSGGRQDWRGSNGTAGAVTPIRTFRILTGHYCREYGIVLQSQLVQSTATRTACRNDHGRWIDVTAIVDSPES